MNDEGYLGQGLPEVLRAPMEAERGLSNAMAAIDEAIITLRQYAPPKNRELRGRWGHQVRKLKMAAGICKNVHDAITTRTDFDKLRSKP